MPLQPGFSRLTAPASRAQNGRKLDRLAVLIELSRIEAAAVGCRHECGHRGARFIVVGEIAATLLRELVAQRPEPFDQFLPRRIVARFRLGIKRSRCHLTKNSNLPRRGLLSQAEAFGAAVILISRPIEELLEDQILFVVFVFV